MARRIVWANFERWIHRASRTDLMAKRSSLTGLSKMKDLTPAAEVERMIALIDDQLVLRALGKDGKVSNLVKPHIGMIMQARKDGKLWSTIAIELQEFGIFVNHRTLAYEISVMHDGLEKFQRTSSVGRLKPHFKTALKMRIAGKTWKEISTALKAEHNFEITQDLLRYATTVLTESLQQAPAQAEKSATAPARAAKSKAAPKPKAKLKSRSKTAR